MVTNYLTRVVQMFGDFWGYVERWHFLSKKTVATFGQLLDNLGYFFNPTSGHTGHNHDGKGDVREERGLQMFFAKKECQLLIWGGGIFLKKIQLKLKLPFL